MPRRLNGGHAQKGADLLDHQQCDHGVRSDADVGSGPALEEAADPVVLEGLPGAVQHTAVELARVTEVARLDHIH